MASAEQARYGKAARRERGGYQPVNLQSPVGVQRRIWIQLLMTQPRPSTVRWLKSLPQEMLHLAADRLIETHIPINAASDPTVISSAKIKRLLNIN
jgi:hypothetical protein